MRNANGVQSPVVHIKFKAVSILSAPSGLKRSNLTLSWNAVRNAKNYKVFVVEYDANGVARYLKSNLVTGNSYTFNTTGLEAGKTYKLRVCAVDKDGRLGKYRSTDSFVYNG